MLQISQFKKEVIQCGTKGLHLQALLRTLPEHPRELGMGPRTAQRQVQQQVVGLLKGVLAFAGGAPVDGIGQGDGIELASVQEYGHAALVPGRIPGVLVGVDPGTGVSEALPCAH